jgi:phosphoenolpyruvate carboxykinase (GTP)
VAEANSWDFGVYMAATMGSETTAAAAGKIGDVRRDPMAMLPFCGYNAADYFDHWLGIGHSLIAPPHIFLVNWFRKGADGKFLWPGYGENMRVLKWVIDRVNGCSSAIQSPIGWVPRFENLSWEGMEDYTEEQYAELMAVKRDEWVHELHSHEELFVLLHDRLPREFIHMRGILMAGLSRSPEVWKPTPS